jgi:hypothetical protein
VTSLQQALAELRTAFPQRDVPVATLALYARQLADLDEAAVVDAVYRLIRTAKFFPTISEIREAAVAGGPMDGLAEAAWAEVRKEAARVGWNRGPVMRNRELVEAEAPVFANPITEAAVASMSWRLICLGEQAEVREQFLWTWKNLSSGLVKRGQAADGGLKGLPGASDLVALKRVK